MCWYLWYRSGQEVALSEGREQDDRRMMEKVGVFTTFFLTSIYGSFRL